MTLGERSEVAPRSGVGEGLPRNGNSVTHEANEPSKT